MTTIKQTAFLLLLAAGGTLLDVVKHLVEEFDTGHPITK